MAARYCAKRHEVFLFWYKEALDLILKDPQANLDNLNKEVELKLPKKPKK